MNIRKINAFHLALCINRDSERNFSVYLKSVEDSKTLFKERRGVFSTIRKGKEYFYGLGKTILSTNNFLKKDVELLVVHPGKLKLSRDVADLAAVNSFVSGLEDSYQGVVRNNEIGVYFND